MLFAELAEAFDALAFGHRRTGLARESGLAIYNHFLPTTRLGGYVLEIHLVRIIEVLDEVVVVECIYGGFHLMLPL